MGKDYKAGVTTESLCDTSEASFGVADFNPKMHQVSFRAGKDIKGPLTVAVSGTLSGEGEKKNGRPLYRPGHVHASRQCFSGIPGQPRPVYEHGGLALGGRGPDFHSAQASGVAAPDDERRADEQAPLAGRDRIAAPDHRGRHSGLVGTPMRKKYFNTLIALVVLAALWGVFTYYDRRHSREASKIETPKEEKIFALDSKHITSITFRPRDGEAVTCQHAGGTWAIVEPKKLSADQGTLSTVLNNLTTATVDEVVDPHPSDLKQFGLDPPAYSLEVSTDSNPPKFTLLLGDDTPTSGGLYAQVAGNPRVVTLASYLKSNLEKTLFDLRDRRALTLEADQLRKIEVDSKGKKWTLEKNPEGVWDLVLPPPVRADRFAVDGLISQLRGLTMQSIAAEDKKNQALMDWALRNCGFS